jgi:Rrf2 family protein
VITKTSLLAIRALLYLAQQGPSVIVSPKRIAQVLGDSPTYLAKVARLLVKVGILRAEKGVKGGVQLNQPPDKVTLLAIVEACQGNIVGNYCQMECDLSLTCAYHQAAAELHQAIVDVLGRWTLSQLVLKPRPMGNLFPPVRCVLLAGGPSGPPPGGLARIEGVR